MAKVNAEKRNQTRLAYGLKLKFSAILGLMSKISPKPNDLRAERKRVFGQGEGTLRAGLYARVSTHDQQTLPMQLSAMRDYAGKRGWSIAVEVKDVGSGASIRQRREELLAAARKREIDLVVVWRLDRWGRSLVDLVNTLQELSFLKVGFVSLSEALDLTTPSGRALAGMLAVFAEFERDILRDRVKAGIAEARKEGRPHGRPLSAALHIKRIRQLFIKGISKREIAKRLGISRTSVRRLLATA
jgi:putative DNA-invertase from lambdoid prophage Rac